MPTIRFILVSDPNIGVEFFSIFTMQLSAIFFFDQCSKYLQLLQQDYERALYYLEACVTIPAMVVSHIMLESYKKYLLVRPHSSSFDVHLLLGGKCDPENENQLKWIIELVSDLLDRFR